MVYMVYYYNELYMEYNYNVWKCMEYNVYAYYL